MLSNSTCAATSWDSDKSGGPKFTTFGDVVLSAAGSGDAVVWKLNQQGTTLWAERGGGGLSTDQTWGNDIMEGVDSDGAVGPEK